MSPGRTATARRTVALFATHKRRLALVAGLILLASGLGVVTPFLVQAMFDDALFVPGGPDLDLVWLLVGLMIAIPVTSAALQVWQTYLTNVVGNRVMQDLRDRLFVHLQRMELGFFTSTKTGQIQSRLANDVGGVQDVLTNTTSSILSNVVTVLASVVAMLLLSWQLTLVSLAVVPIFIFLNVRVGRLRRAVAARTQGTLAQMSATTQESLSVSGVLLAKVFDRQGTEQRRYFQESSNLAGLQVRQQMTGQSFFALVQSFFAITPALIYLVAGLQLSGGGEAISAGTLVAFTTLQTRLLFPIVQLLRVAVDVQTSLALFERVFEYLDLRPAIVDSPGARTVEPGEVHGEVAFEHVEFSYPSPRASTDGVGPADVDDGAAPRRVLDDVSLTVAPGQLAAIVGPSGSGKTTLSYLIPRLYEVDAGAVRIGGHDVRDLTLSSLAGFVGMVTQESYLFHATVRENLLYGREGADQEQLEAAARAALIHDRILDLEQGYDTVVGERGYRLSGGEKQRLAIARVILKDPRILILDEATSALDTTSERLVQRALEPLMADRTSVVIAHRLSTIRAADVIFVIDAGRLVERGTHVELMARDGLYLELYEQQFGGGEVEARCSDGVVLASGRIARVPSPSPQAGVSAASARRRGLNRIG